MHTSHPLSTFAHCPKCAGVFVKNDQKSKRCQQCGFIYYFNPSAAVAALITNSSGELLVSVRGNEPARGSYDLPGGFVDSFESGEQSVVREVMEECNIELSEVCYLYSIPNIYPFSDFDVHTLDIFFQCHARSFEGMRAGDDVAHLEFIPLDKIDISKFGLTSVREGVRRFLERTASI